MSDSMTGKLDIVLSASADKVTQEVDKVNTKLDQMQSRAQATAQRMIAGNQSAANSFVGVVTAAQRNIEAIDRLGSKTDEISGKHHTAWLAIGAVIGGTAQESIRSISGIIDRLDAVPAAVQAGFKPLIEAQLLANDRSELTNATISKQIALIEKKPVNNSAIALAEAKIAADELAASLEGVESKMEQVLSRNHISAWAQLIGKAPTANAEGTINSFDEQFSDISRQIERKRHSGDEAGAVALEKALDAKMSAAGETYRRMRKTGDSPGGLMGYVDGLAVTDFVQTVGSRLGFKQNRDGRDSMLADAETLTESSRTGIAKNREDAGKAAQLAQLQDQQHNAELQREAAAKAEAERQRAYHAQMSGFEQQLAAMQKQSELMPAAVRHFWSLMQMQTEDGSLAWLDINKRIGEESQKVFRSQREKLRQDSDETLRMMEESVKGMAAWQRDDRKAGLERFTGSDTLNLIQARAGAELAEAKIGEQAGRTMTMIAGATETAAINTRLYAQELETLQREIARIKGNGDLSASERETQLNGKNAELQQLQGRRTVQQLQDQSRVQLSDSIGLVGAKDALAEFTRQALDSASQMKNLLGAAIGDINKTVVAQITSRSRSGPRHLWTGVGGDLARKVTGSALERGEGLFLGGLGLGGAKAPKGTAADPLHVIMASIAGTTSALGKAAGAATAGTGGALATVGSWIGKALPFIPGFADGVEGFGGGWAMVGEQGPELRHLGAGTSIIPHSKSMEMLNGGGRSEIHNHFDLRGNTDPAQAEAAMHRVVRLHYPSISGYSQQIAKDAKRRQTNK